MHDDLIQFATAREIEYIEAIKKHGSERKAAAALNVSRGSISGALGCLKHRAALRGYSPDHQYSKVVPDGFKVKGVSQYYDKQGKLAGQWVKSSADDDRRMEMLQESIKALCSEIKPIPEVSLRHVCHKNLLNVIPFGDPHVGMYAWQEESGDDFDSNIARRLTLSAVDRLLESAPHAETCIILPLGDVFHANDQSNVTPGHKHQLDVDSRFVKVLQIGIETFRHTVIRALEKHEKVIVRFVSGNHDPQSIWALAFTIAAYFSDNPRVTVDLSPSKFWFYRHGKVLIGATHGDTVKHENLLGVMACDRAKDWGETKHRYWYTGHVHHQSVKEFPGVVCESFRTLAAKDAYAAGHGYRAGRDMLCITHHTEHGEIERHRADVGMLD